MCQAGGGCILIKLYTSSNFSPHAGVIGVHGDTALRVIGHHPQVMSGAAQHRTSS